MDKSDQTCPQVLNVERLLGYDVSPPRVGERSAVTSRELSRRLLRVYLREFCGSASGGRGET